MTKQTTTVVIGSLRVKKRLHVKFGQEGSEEKSFKDVDGQTGRWTDGGRQVITISYPKPLAQVSAKSDRGGERGVLEIQNTKKIEKSWLSFTESINERE